jgi:hypothetical protein
MRPLLSPQDRDRLVAPLRRRMRRQAMLGGRAYPALAEDAGAQVVELGAHALGATLFADPALRDQDASFADGMLDGIMALDRAALPGRRLALRGLEVRQDDPRGFEIASPFHIFRGDLSAGMVLQWIHGRVGGRPGEVLGPAIHSGNMVEFRIDRHPAHVDAEAGISAFGVERIGGTDLAPDLAPESVLLWHETPVTAKAGWLRARRVAAGVLRYAYTISANTPVLRLAVSFRATHPIGQLRLTTALDALGREGLDLAEGRVQTAEGWGDIAPSPKPALQTWAADTAVRHVAIGQAGWPAQGPTLHLRPGAPAGVLNVKAVTRRPPALHWLVARHGPIDVAAGSETLVTEDRLLAAGLSLEEAVQAMQAPPGTPPPAPNPCGAALAAMATHLLYARAGAYRQPPSGQALAAREAWLDERLAALAEAGGAVEDVAFGLLAADLLRRAGGGAATLDALARRVLAAQGSAGGIGATGLVGHAAAMLALAQAGPAIAGGAPDIALGRALAALRLEDGAILATGTGPSDPGRVAEALALLLRALDALAEVAPVPAVEGWRQQAISLLRALVRTSPDALEVWPSAAGSGATTAAQAGAGLALLRRDAFLRGLPVPETA